MNKTNNLKEWYENLNPNSLVKISEFYDENVFFKDPFNEFKGIGLVQQVFDHMFTNLKNPRFIFIDIIEAENAAFLTWDFIFLIKEKEFKIHGSTHLKFNANNKVIYHRDYWDVGEEVLMKIPLIQIIYRFFRSKLASK